jgi:hypothetical protein
MGRKVCEALEERGLKGRIEQDSFWRTTAAILYLVETIPLGLRMYQSTGHGAVEYAVRPIGSGDQFSFKKSVS